MTDIKKLAVEQDTTLKVLYTELAKAKQQSMFATNDIFRAAGATRNYRTQQWDKPFNEAWDIVEAKGTHSELLQEWTKRFEAINVFKKSIEVIDQIWQAERWNRAYLVTNAGGHVHKSMSCSTCYPSTQFDWRVEYSGSSEAEIVEAAGELACTVCYPSAPVDVLSRPSAFTAEQREAAEVAKAERAKAKAEREAAARAKAPTASGEPLTIKWQYGDATRFGNGWRSEVFKTERTAIAWAVDTLFWDSVSNYKQPAQVEQVAVVVEAIAEKRGVAADEVWAEIRKKAAKRERN